MKTQQKNKARELAGEEFSIYQKKLSSIDPSDERSAAMYDFEEYKAYPVFEIESPGTKYQRQVLKGVLLEGEVLRLVKTEMRFARMHNKQIESGQSRANGGTFYILKQKES